MKKKLAIVLVLLAFFVMTACTNETAVLDVSKTYQITSDIHSLEIQINAAEFIIEHGNTFSVESNLKNLSVSEKNGVLTIIDETKKTANYPEPTLKLCVPYETVFERVTIATGAAKLTADSLSANSLELKLGAGKVEFAHLNAYSNIHIEGGAGEIDVISGTLNNLTLVLGVGKLDMTAALLGKSDLNFGVGSSNLTLLGSKNDYKVEVEKGIGSITIGGKTISDSGSSGNGQHHIRIQGGIGAVNVAFQESLLLPVYHAVKTGTCR